MFLVSVLSSQAFGEACPRNSRSVRLSATGDILVHKPLFEEVINIRSRHVALWAPLVSILRDADLTVGNLEGAVAPGVVAGGYEKKDPGFRYDASVYTGTDYAFNYHPYLLADLQSSGFDLLTTSNNHSLDRSALGVDRTIDELNKIGMDFVGTRKRGSDEVRAKILNVSGMRIGVISCTEDMNENDPSSQALRCSNAGILPLITELKSKTDAVVVFPHWGPEYETQPTGDQKRRGRSFVQAGALAVIGNHPHVLQTSEWITTDDGRESVIVYSLGNFVACQGAYEKRISAILHLDFERGPNGVRIQQFSHTPIIRPNGSISLIKVESGSKDSDYVTRKLGPARCR